MPLKKSIGRKTLLILTINAILGTGIFFLPAIGAQYSGTSSIFSWAIMSVVAVFISLYFAELISMFPKSGGAYEFIKNAFGKTHGFIFGWLSWIVANITIAMLVVGSILYIIPGAHAVAKITAALVFILLFNFVNYRGIGISSKMLLFFGLMTLGVMLALIVPGLFTIDASNFSTIFAAPLPLVLLTVYFIAETFFGWETTTYLSEEVKDARRVLPKMLVIATAIIAAISMLIIFVAFGNADPSTFAAQEAPLAFLASNFFGSEAGAAFAVLIFIPLIGTAASWIVSSPRLLYAMSRDRILTRRFAHVHKKHKTPHVAIFFQTAVTIGLTLLAFGNYLFLLSLLVPLVLVMYSMVMMSVIKLRYKSNAKRYFNAPFPRAGPVIIILFNACLLFTWLLSTPGAAYVFVMGISLVALGFPLYVVMRLQNDRKFTERFYDRISFIWDSFFHIWYGEREAERIVRRLKLKHDSKVLDFGCGSGNTTAAISRRASGGTVVAVDLSAKQIEHAVKKIKKMDMHNVIFVKGSFRIPKNSFDAVTGVGVLEHLDRPRSYVSSLLSSLKKGGRFYFLSFGKSLGIPGPEFIETDAKIKDLFRNLRADVKIERKKKRFAEYVSIYGVKK